jgi:HK97 family phage portal protein
VERKVADASALTWEAIYGGPTSKTGASVNVTTALRVSTVLGCCRVVAEDVSKVPLGLFQDLADGSKRRASDHSLHEVLARTPNPWMTSMEFRETLCYHASLTHGGFAFINRVGGEVRELIPLMPQNVVVKLLRGSFSGLEVAYEVSDAAGRIATLLGDQVFRVRGPSWNGWSGLELVREAAEAVGLAISIEETQARLHANGVQGGGILSTDQTLNKDAVDRIRGQFSDSYGGAAQFKTKVLDAGLKFQSMMMTGVDAQHLETRKHQVEEICRFFRVNPVKIFAGDKSSTYASVEQFSISHVVDTLLPWFTRWEQALDRSLLTKEDLAKGFYTHHTVQGLLRGDSAARSAFYKAGINDGWMTRNEARKFEELDPIAELEKPLKPLNMETVEPDEVDQADPAAAADVGDGTAGAAAVQDTALNGAQVASLLAIVQAVAAGQLPASTAREMILASFPAVAPATIDAMLAGLADFVPPEEPPAPTGPPPDAGAKAFGGSLERAFASLALGLSSRGGEPEIEFIRDPKGQVIGAKPKKK